MASSEEPPGAEPIEGPPQLTHLRVLGSRLHVHNGIRLILAIVIVVGAPIGRHLVRIDDLDVTALLLLGIGIFVYNAVAWAAIRKRQAPTAENRAVLVRVHYASIILDYLSLAVAIWVIGGVRSPFLPFFLLHAILSCLMLPRRQAIIFHWMAYAFIVALVLVEWAGLEPGRLPFGASPHLDGRYAITVVVVYGALFAVSAVLLLGLARRLRQGERRVRELSRARRDFLDIALHNLQSPIGAATMFMTNLKSGLGGPVTDKQAEWIDRGLSRLGGIAGFLKDLHLVSKLEGGRMAAQAAEVNIAEMVRVIVAENRDLAEGRGHEITAEVEESLPRVHGVGLLLREAVVNYVTNAVKYTPEGGKIVVRAVSAPPMVRIEVTDNGVGVSKEDQARLFSEFVRLKSKDRTLGKVEGTGLGLTIVKRVVAAHGGTVSVRSEPGKGSTFTLELPAVAENPEIG